MKVGLTVIGNEIKVINKEKVAPGTYFAGMLSALKTIYQESRGISNKEACEELIEALKRLKEE